MDESRIGQYSISVTTYPIMALEELYDISYNTYLIVKWVISKIYGIIHLNAGGF